MLLSSQNLSLTVNDMKPQDIDRIEIEKTKVTVFNIDGEAIASSEYASNERAMEVANELFNQKMNHYKNLLKNDPLCV